MFIKHKQTLFLFLYADTQLCIKLWCRLSSRYWEKKWIKVYVLLPLEWNFLEWWPKIYFIPRFAVFVLPTLSLCCQPCPQRVSVCLARTTIKQILIPEFTREGDLIFNQNRLQSFTLTHFYLYTHEKHNDGIHNICPRFPSLSWKT